MSMLVFLALAFLHQFIEKMAPVRRLALTLPHPSCQDNKIFYYFFEFPYNKNNHGTFK